VLILLGMGFLTYQGLILSKLWVPLWRVHCIPSFAMQHFSKPFIFLSFFCGPDIECYVQENKNITTIPLEVRTH
jgi:hypothetical protein